MNKIDPVVREQGQVILHAPPEFVFDAIGNPANLQRMLRGNLAEAHDVEPLPGGGYKYRWVYRWAGFPIQADAAMITYERPEKIVVKSTAGMETYSTWILHPLEGDTEANFTIEAPLQNWLLRRVSERFIRNQLRYAVDIALSNIKSIIEHDFSEQQQRAVPKTISGPLMPPAADAPKQNPLL